MATICATPFKVPAIRVTQLDECGAVVEGECSTVASSGIITVEIAREYEDREDFFKKNGDGVFCVTETDPPILKWINLTLTFCDVNPQLVRLLAGEALLEDDAAEPNIIGFRNSQGASATVNAAVEVWTRTSGTSNCGEGTTRYGYLLFPWMIEGTISDLTLENGAADFILTARTQQGSPWGVGPYTVVQSAALATLGDPMPLFDAVEPLDHEIWLWTTLPPPNTACDCLALPLALEGVVGEDLEVTITLPVGVLPAFIDWGDLDTETVLTGPTVVHTYALAGTYDIQVWPTDMSSAPYTITLVVA